jgi:hypothetical protein
VLGIGVAGLIETFRPTLVGSDSLAREFDTPLLGTIPTEEDEQRGRQVLTRIALRLRLAADSVNAHDVGLVAVGPDVELGLLGATIDELANDVLLTERPRRIASAEAVSSRFGAAPMDSEASAPTAARVRIRPFGLLEGRSDNGNTVLVLVSPNVVKKDDVDEVTHLLRLTGAPLLGLITYARPRERRSRFDVSALRKR